MQWVVLECEVQRGGKDPKEPRQPSWWVKEGWKSFFIGDLSSMVTMSLETHRYSLLKRVKKIKIMVPAFVLVL